MERQQGGEAATHSYSMDPNLASNNQKAISPDTFMAKISNIDVHIPRASARTSMQSLNNTPRSADSQNVIIYSATPTRDDATPTAKPPILDKGQLREYLKQQLKHRIQRKSFSTEPKPIAPTKTRKRSKRSPLEVGHALSHLNVDMMPFTPLFDTVQTPSTVISDTLWETGRMSLGESDGRMSMVDSMSALTPDMIAMELQSPYMARYPMASPLYRPDLGYPAENVLESIFEVPNEFHNSPYYPFPQ